MNALLKSQFWLTNLKGNAVLFVFAFTINWIKNPGNPMINHEYHTYWHVVGGTSFLCANLLFFLFTRFVLRR